MKKYLKVFLIIIAVCLVAGWIWWQQNKKGIIRDSIENAVSQGTDSLYFIQYDSSSIDELAGNATFYNVRMQSQTLEQQLMLLDTASEQSIFNVRIGKVLIKGANVPALLSNSKVQASSIEIVNPVIYIINSGKKNENSPKPYDTLAIYEKILGKYKSLQAGEIIVSDGYLHFTDKTGIPQTSLNQVNINLKNFRIDSTKDYNNITSYFIKDVVAKVKEIKYKTTKHHITFSAVEYNAPGKFISLQKFSQKDTLENDLIDISNTMITGISTDSFILRQQIKAEAIKTDGGLVTLYRKKGANKNNSGLIDIDNNIFNEATVDAINIGNTKVVIYNTMEPKQAPFVLSNAKFIATDIQKLHSGTNIKKLISASNWKLSASGFNLMSDNKRYSYEFGPFEIDNTVSKVFVNSFKIRPTMTEEAFSKMIKVQEDRYDILFTDVSISDVDINKMISENIFIAGTLSLRPVLRVFNDRTVTPNPASKVGKYPHQQLQEIPIPFYVKKVLVKNAGIYYKERGALSRQTGVVFFEHVQGTITNVTNMKERMAVNNVLTLDATGKFMGISNLHTTWKLPLNTATGQFKVAGNATGFNAEGLNKISEPLGMASIRSGEVRSLSFDMTGDDYKASGTTTLVYDNLKMEMLKKDSNELVKKGFMSFIANALMKNSNLDKEAIKPVSMKFSRDTTKSFFNLVWKTIFEGTKNTIQKL